MGLPPFVLRYGAYNKQPKNPNPAEPEPEPFGYYGKIDKTFCERGIEQILSRTGIIYLIPWRGLVTFSLSRPDGLITALRGLCTEGKARCFSYGITTHARLIEIFSSWSY